LVERDFTLEATEEEYLSSGSKFIAFPPGSKIGDIQYRNVECETFDWDTPGQSIKIEVIVTDGGMDYGKEDKISFGIDAKKPDGKPGGLWKGRLLYKQISGKEMPMISGADGNKHPKPDPLDIEGKAAVGVWTMQEGKKGGVGEPVNYPKLTDILQAGSRPKQEDLGL
jgi:hypothetical protein